MDAMKRNRKVYHIDYEDLLYIMGKGPILRLGFIYHHQLMNQYQSSDCKIEFFVENQSGGLKARVIAEDIISYAQMRLAETSKNR
mmetsp:Transcript_40381/g.61618  ORF Transcript_40381/g.61618 Transcript_40381/m.61618 type:complete len:85 (-) Transcript_40381:215-469(-)